MLEYQGSYGKAKVMIDDIDQMTVSQIYEFLNHEAFTNPIAIMPDTHAGNGAVIGFTMEMTSKVIPNVVGVDINCGMYSINVGKNVLAEMSKPDIDNSIRTSIPFGTSVHSKTVNIEPGFWLALELAHRDFVMKFNKRYGTSYDLSKFDMKFLEQKCDDIGMDTGRVINSVGTLGGGNHFIELGKSQLTGDYWFTIHSGSRQFGLKICNYWQRKAGKGSLAYLTGDDMFGYLSDMVVAQMYAELNRLHMANHVLQACNLSWNDVKMQIKTNHNFIDFDDFIIRKGAIRSYIGEQMIIPFNMEDGILICSGRSNPEWNFSAPHGAGRVGSRKWAKANLSLSEAEHRMEKKKIYCSKLPNDELKGAYKDPKIIEDAIEPTAMIVDRLKPVLAMKD
jgi:tRNA-splicing ligase RtcB (3'-phosphate/5'-hydroxy nucleic acid ligase)